MPTVVLRIEGLPHLLAKLDGDALLGRPWRRAMRGVVDILRGEAERNAPRATGRLAGSITDKMDARPIPLWGVVTANAASPRGVRYPFVLQAGHRARRATGSRTRVRSLKVARAAGEIMLRYAGTRRSTRGWITKGLRKAKSEMRMLLGNAAREIERHWSS